MKLRFSNDPAPQLSRGGFTMIEIAIALGVIGFALVAIMGILPLGLNVQRDNRFETIINQDATYWLEAIRNGAHETSIDSIDLTNYVERIEIVKGNNTVTYKDIGVPPLDYSSNIIGILTRPFDKDITVYANVRAFSGAAGEKRSDVSFTYQMEVQLLAVDPVTGVGLVPPITPPALWELRLVMRWPVITVGKPPTARKPLQYRTMVTRHVMSHVWGSETNHWLTQ